MLEHVRRARKGVVALAAFNSHARVGNINIEKSSHRVFLVVRASSVIRPTRFLAVHVYLGIIKTRAPRRSVRTAILDNTNRRLNRCPASRAQGPLSVGAATTAQVPEDPYVKFAHSGSFRTTKGKRRVTSPSRIHLFSVRQIQSPVISR